MTAKYKEYYVSTHKVKLKREKCLPTDLPAKQAIQVDDININVPC